MCKWVSHWVSEWIWHITRSITEINANKLCSVLLYWSMNVLSAEWNILHTHWDALRGKWKPTINGSESLRPTTYTCVCLWVNNCQNVNFIEKKLSISSNELIHLYELNSCRIVIICLITWYRIYTNRFDSIRHTDKSYTFYPQYYSLTHTITWSRWITLGFYLTNTHRHTGTRISVEMSDTNTYMDAHQFTQQEECVLTPCGVPVLWIR